MVKRKRISKKTLGSVVFAAVVALLVSALLIVNIFLPVRYLSAYLFVSRQPLPQDGSRLTFLDVGYGNCTLAEFSDGSTLLIDGGDGGYANQWRLLKLLNERGVYRLDFLVCTSVSAEHCGGLAELLRYRQAGKIYMPYCAAEITREFNAFTEAVQASGAEICYCEYGAGERGADWAFTFLSPSARTLAEGEYAALEQDPSQENILNASAVLWLRCSGVNALLLGDAPPVVQDRLLAQDALGALSFADGETLRLEECDLLQTACHGEERGLFSPLIEGVKPRAAVSSCQAGAQSGVIAALAPYADTYATGEAGRVTFLVTDGDFTVETQT